MREWTIEAFGRNPDLALGDSLALGSGCSPGTDSLPDGVWFGWVTDFAATHLEFDLACLWPGRIHPAAGNDVHRIRTIQTAADALIYLGDSDPMSYSPQGAPITKAATNAPGLPDTLPYWLFINNGMVTELAQYPDPIEWARSSTAWPELMPGCCDGGTTAPPSPDDPWPAGGWPAAGFYNVWVGEAAWAVADSGEPYPDAVAQYELTLFKWLSCRDHPELCPDWWVGEEVTVDRRQPTLDRTLDLDDDLKVVIMPIFGESPIWGDGVAFSHLLIDMNDAVGTWRGDEETALTLPELKDRSADPAFPLGTVIFSNHDDGPLGYWGPGGSHLTWYGWWFALEIRDGLPVLYIHAGLVAG